MLKMNLLWNPPVRDLVERDLNHFRFGVVDLGVRGTQKWRALCGVA
jgi:hypothetical protein